MTFVANYRMGIGLPIALRRPFSHITVPIATLPRLEFEKD